VNLRGAVVVVTGASSGIGEATALRFADAGARVVLAARRVDRLEALADRIHSRGGEALAAGCDVTSPDEIDALVARVREAHDRIDVLVNNAGLVSGRRQITADGLELTMAVNHFAPFLLTNLLLPRLEGSARSRVVTTSSDAHRGGLIDVADLNGERRWSAWSAYGNSKLANILFTRALAHRLAGRDTVANCLHPGVIRTGLARGAPLPIRIGWRAASVFFGSPKKGASTIVHLATAPEALEISGAYWVDSRPATPSIQAQDDDLAEQLWAASERLTGLGER
jgi:retinol dehydrogenase 12